MKNANKTDPSSNTKNSSTLCSDDESAMRAVDTGRVTRSASNEAHLETRHLLGDLKNLALSSTAVSVTAQGAGFALNTLSVIALTRLLVPKDFGLVAMVTSVMGFIRVFRDVGLSIPTVQRAEITHAQVSNLFWINVVMGTSASLLLVAVAPAIVWFFGEPQLLAITLALAGTFFLSGLTVQHRAILARQMRFTAVSLIDLVTVTTGLVVGIVMALAEFRYWSLVGQMISTEITLVALTWTVCRWRPGLPVPRSGTRPLITLGAGIAGGSLLYALARGTDTILVGRFFGSDAVGLYSRAMALLVRPLDQILPALNSVFVPTLSRLQNDPVRYRRAFIRTFEAMALTVFPVTGLTLALAEPLTRVVFGPGWEGVTPIFASLAIGGLFLPLTNVATWIFYSSGRGGDWLKASVVLSALMIISFAAGLPFGPTGVASAFSISGVVIAQPVLYYLAGRRGAVSTTDLWVSASRYLPLWGAVYGSTYLAHTMTVDQSPLSQLLVCGPIGLLSGAMVAGIVAPIRRSAMDVLGAARDVLKR